MPTLMEYQVSHGEVHYLDATTKLTTVNCEVDWALDPPMPLVSRCYDRGRNSGQVWMIKPLAWGFKARTVVTRWGVYDLRPTPISPLIAPMREFIDVPLSVPLMWAIHQRSA